MCPSDVHAAVSSPAARDHPQRDGAKRNGAGQRGASGGTMTGRLGSAMQRLRSWSTGPRAASARRRLG